MAENICVGGCLYVDSDGVLQVKVDPNGNIVCGTNGLKTGCGPYVKSAQFGSSKPGTHTLGGPGQVHAQIVEKVVNDDECSRNMVFYVTYSWGGFGSLPTSGQTVDINSEYKLGPTWFTPYDTVFEFDGSVQGNQNNGAGAWTETFSLSYGQEMELGIRYKVGNTQTTGVKFGPDSFYTCKVSWIGIANG